MSSEKIMTFEDLFYHQLRILFDAEQQLIDNLPRLAARASDLDLKEAMQKHVQETIEHRNRLQKIGKLLNIPVEGCKCSGMEGLLNESNEIFSTQIERDINDAALIATAQKVEHYEISAYGTACEYADMLNLKEVAEILKETLEEEKKTDKLLNEMAKSRINQKANRMSQPSNFYGRHG